MTVKKTGNFDPKLQQQIDALIKAIKDLEARVTALGG